MQSVFRSRRDLIKYRCSTELTSFTRTHYHPSLTHSLTRPQQAKARSSAASAQHPWQPGRLNHCAMEDLRALALIQQRPHRCHRWHAQARRRHGAKKALAQQMQRLVRGRQTRQDLDNKVPSPPLTCPTARTRVICSIRSHPPQQKSATKIQKNVRGRQSRRRLVMEVRGRERCARCFAHPPNLLGRGWC